MTKNSSIDLFRKYWFVGLVLCAFIAASSNLLAMWNLPEEFDELKTEIRSFVSESKAREARQDAILEGQSNLMKQQGRILNLMLTRKIDEVTHRKINQPNEERRL